MRSLVIGGALALLVASLVVSPVRSGGFPAKSPFAPVLRVPFGDGPGTLPGPRRGPIAQGIASSFQRCRGELRLLVPDLRKILAFDEKGRFVREIVPHDGERLLPETAMLVDFDCDAAGRAYVLERRSGQVLCLDEEGRILHRFGAFVHGDELAVRGDRIAVRDAETGTISVFSLSGKLLWQREGRIWSVHLGAGSAFYGIHHGKGRARLLTAPPSRYAIGRGSPVPGSAKGRLLATLRPVEKGHAFFDARIVGVEPGGSLVVLTVEGGGTTAEITYLRRFDASGKALDRRPLPLWWAMSMELPRELRMTPSGEILGLQWDAHAYEIVSVPFPATAPSREGEE